MSGTVVGTFLGVMALLFLLGLGAAVAGAVLVTHRVRRRWRLVRSHGAVVLLLGVWEAIGARRVRHQPVRSFDEGFWSSPRHVRRELRQSVAAANETVRTAEELGAPVAELPVLCRRLEWAATDLDRVLRLDSSGPVPVSMRGSVHDVLRAAEDVRRVAVTAAGEACDPSVAELVRDTADEVRVLGAGLASARKVAGLPPR